MGRVGRPTADRVEAINRAILAAAKEQFFRVGVPAASMDTIRAQAGVSKGTLYSRYPTKDALLAAVIESQLADWIELESFPEYAGEPVAEVLRVHGRLLMRYALDPDMRGIGDLLRGPAAPPRELVHRMYDAGYRRGIRHLAGMIDAATAADGRPARRPERVAELLMTIVIGWAHSHEIVGDATPAAAEEAADQAVEFLLAAREVW
jgi:TetR/AcrR family transcriptional repressor of mexJK operon